MSPHLSVGAWIHRPSSKNPHGGPVMSAARRPLSSELAKAEPERAEPHSFAPHSFASAKRLHCLGEAGRGKCGQLDSARNTPSRSASGASRSAKVGPFNPGLALRATAGAIQGATANAALEYLQSGPGSSPIKPVEIIHAVSTGKALRASLRRPQVSL